MNLLLGDCLERLKELPDNSIDAVVTDPPYGISFMAKKWDYDVPKVNVWEEVLRVLKPGGHALVACGTRTQHRMAVNLEDAGFEIRDIVSWVYGSGFPKSLNIGIAVDKTLKNIREVVQIVTTKDFSHHRGSMMSKETTENFTTKSKEVSVTKGNSQFEGWGTALKPAMELFTLCRKPLSEKNIAENCLKWGTGGINIDGCRVGDEERDNPPATQKINTFNCSPLSGITYTGTIANGRFPANLIHDGSDEVLSLFPNDTARFFYCPKAGKKERNEGLEEFEEVRRTGYGYSQIKGSLHDGMFKDRDTLKKNFHPTVKPIALMSYLCRLITPPNGMILDPFMGSGSTGCAAVKEGFNFTGIELDPEYFKIAEARINYHLSQNDTLFSKK